MMYTSSCTDKNVTPGRYKTKNSYLHTSQNQSTFELSNAAVGTGSITQSMWYHSKQLEHSTIFRSCASGILHRQYTDIVISNAVFYRPIHWSINLVSWPSPLYACAWVREGCGGGVQISVGGSILYWNFRSEGNEFYGGPNLTWQASDYQKCLIPTLSPHIPRGVAGGACIDRCFMGDRHVYLPCVHVQGVR